MMQPRTICTIAALLFGGAMNSAICQTAPPSTPPTHPTMRDTPTTAPDQSGATRKKAGSLDEAKQACKNLTGDAAQRDCLAKAEKDFKDSKSSTSPTK
jgi:hypothetical protein